MNLEFYEMMKSLIATAEMAKARIEGPIGKIAERFKIFQKDIAKGARYVATSFSTLRTAISKSLTDTKNKIFDFDKALPMSYDQLQKKIKKVEKQIASARVPSAIRKMRGELDQLQKASDRHIGNTKRKGSTTQDSPNNSASLGRSFLPSVASIGSGFAKVVQAGLDRQKITANLEFMAGKEAGGKLKNDLASYAKNTVYDNDVFKNAETMMGSGISAEAVMPNLKMLGDVARGDVEKLNSLTDAFSNVRTSGTLTEETLADFKRSGFDPLKEISEATGVSMDVLREDMNSGAITFSALEVALRKATGQGGEFYRMTEEMGQTDFGQVEIMQGKLSELTTQIGELLGPTVGFFVENYLSPFIDKISEAVTWIEENWNWISILISMLGTLLVVYEGITFATTLWSAAQLALNTVMMLNPIYLVIAAIGALVVGVMVAWNKFEGFRKFVTESWEGIKKIFSSIGKFFTGSSGAESDTIAEIEKTSKEAEKKSVKTRTATGGVASTPESTSDVAATLAGLKKETATQKGNADHVASSTTSAGPRVININGVKFTDKIELHVNNLTEGLNEIEAKFDEYLLRILNSGSALQS
jgi:hypothetical protein